MALEQFTEFASFASEPAAHYDMPLIAAYMQGRPPEAREFVKQEQQLHELFTKAMTEAGVELEQLQTPQKGSQLGTTICMPVLLSGRGGPLVRFAETYAVVPDTRATDEDEAVTSRRDCPADVLWLYKDLSSEAGEDYERNVLATLTHAARYEAPLPKGLRYLIEAGSPQLEHERKVQNKCRGILELALSQLASEKEPQRYYED